MLRYTPRNPPPWFLCLELLCLSAWQLHLHQLSSVSSPFIIGGCTPSIRCLCNSSLSILVCIGKVFACCHHQEHKRLHVVQLFTQSLLWASSGNSSSPCTCRLITIPRWILWVLLHNLYAIMQFLFSRFSLFLAYVWQQLILSQHTSKSK